MLKNKTILSIILLCTLGGNMTLAQADESTQKNQPEQQIITRSDQIEVIKAPAEHFTGDAYFSRYPVMPSEGDVVWCSAGVKHWHGATSYSGMTHVAISPVSKDKPSATWLERPELTEQDIK